MLSVTKDEGIVQVCATLNTEFLTEVDIALTLATSDVTGKWLMFIDNC